jgi:hypothetical protein
MYNWESLERKYSDFFNGKLELHKIKVSIVIRFLNKSYKNLAIS